MSGIEPRESWSPEERRSKVFAGSGRLEKSVRETLLIQGTMSIGISPEKCFKTPALSISLWWSLGLACWRYGNRYPRLSYRSLDSPSVLSFPRPPCSSLVLFRLANSWARYYHQNKINMEFPYCQATCVRQEYFLPAPVGVRTASWFHPLRTTAISEAFSFAFRKKPPFRGAKY